MRSKRLSSPAWPFAATDRAVRPVPVLPAAHPSPALVPAPALVQDPAVTFRATTRGTARPRAVVVWPKTVAIPKKVAPPAAVVSLPPSDPIAQAVFASVNSSRRAAGLAPLSWSSGLQRSAHAHNLAMAAANTMSHQLPGEASFGVRESAQGVHWTTAAENIGWTTDMSTSGALSIENYMMSEPAGQPNHRANILSASNEVGVDIVLDTTNGKLWLTEDFVHS